MSAHADVIQAYGSAYACAKATGVPYDTCKRWWRVGRLSDPARWQVVLAGAGLDRPEIYKQLAQEYSR